MADYFELQVETWKGLNIENDYGFTIYSNHEKYEEGMDLAIKENKIIESTFHNIWDWLSTEFKVPEKKLIAILQT